MDSSPAASTLQIRCPGNRVKLRIATSPAQGGGDSGDGIQAQTPQFGTPGQQAPNIPGNEAPGQGGQGNGQQPQQGQGNNDQWQQNQSPVRTTAPDGPQQTDRQQPGQPQSGQPSSPTVTVTKTESQCAVPGAGNGAAGTPGGPGSSDSSRNGGTGPDNNGNGEKKDGAPSWAYLVGEVTALMTGRRGRKAGPLNKDGSTPTNDMVPNDQIDGENYKQWTTPDGKRTFILSENADAPSQYRFALDNVKKPDGGSADVNDDGTLSTYDRDGNEVDRFTPWAYDTVTGQKIPTSYTRDGDDLVQTIDRPEGNNNPILADPPGDTPGGGGASGEGADNSTPSPTFEQTMASLQTPQMGPTLPPSPPTPSAPSAPAGTAMPTEQQVAQTAGSILPAISTVVPPTPAAGSPAVSVEVSPQLAQNPLIQAVQGRVPTQVKTPEPGTPQDNGLSSVSVGDPSGQVDTTVVSNDGGTSRSQSTRDRSGSVDTVTQTFDGSRIDGHTQVDSNGNPVTSSWIDTPGNRGTVDNTSPQQRTHVDVADQYGGGYIDTITTGENGNIYETVGVNDKGDVIESTATDMGQLGLVRHYRINGVDEEVIAAGRINELGDPARLRIFNEKVKPAQEAYERAVRDLYTSPGDWEKVTAAQGQLKRTHAALLAALGEYGLVPKFDPGQISQTGNGTYEALMTGPDGNPITGGNGKPLMAKIHARPDGGFDVSQDIGMGLNNSTISPTNGYEGTQYISKGVVQDKSLDTFLGILDVVGVAAAAPGAGRALGGLLRVGGEQIGTNTLKEGGGKAVASALRTTADEAGAIGARASGASVNPAKSLISPSTGKPIDPTNPADFTLAKFLTPAEMARYSGERAYIGGLIAGRRFDTVMNSRYQISELAMRQTGPGGRPLRLDAYVPRQAIISRKFTQLGDIQASTARAYIDEFTKKYPVGAKIGNSAQASSQGLEGQFLRGFPILQVPPQAAEIPSEIASYAAQKGIYIVDASGNVLNQSMLPQLPASVRSVL